MSLGIVPDPWSDSVKKEGRGRGGQREGKGIGRDRILKAVTYRDTETFVLSFPFSDAET